MTRGLTLVAALALTASPTWAEEIEVPSGQKVTYYDTIQNQPGPAGLTYRFRFIAPGISRGGMGLDADQVAADMDYLCANYAVPRLAAIGPIPSQVVISLSDRPVAFGTAAPDATQYFEAYRIADGACVWEAF